MKHFFKKLLLEPLFQFLAIGAALFLIFGWRGDSATQPGGQSAAQSVKIVVSQGQIENMAAQFRRIWQRPPTGQELQGLIDSHVRDEISYREAMALGLDHDDAIIRRRMRLKLETLNEDIATAMSPTDQDLQTFLEQHPDSFLKEPRAAFRQVFLDPESHGAKIEADARTLLARLKAAGPAADLSRFGDPLVMLANDQTLSTVSEIGTFFGEQFARSIVELEKGKWLGPLRSGYGWHLVLVTERQPGRLPELAEVRDQVEREWVFTLKKEMQEAMYKRLGERYTMIIEQPAPTVTTAVADAKTRSGGGVR